MEIKTVAQQNPGELRYTLTMTESVDGWQLLAKSLPDSTLRQAIYELTRHALAGSQALEWRAE